MVELGVLGVLAQAGTGLLVLLAGVAALAAVKPKRHTVAFSLLLVLWGSYLLAGNLAALALDAGRPGQAQELLLLHAVIQGVAYLPLAVFALSYPPSRSVDLDGRTAAVLLAPLGALATAVVVDPGLFHEGFTGDSLTSNSRWGPGKVAGFVLFRGVVYATIARLVLARERSTNPVERRQALHVLLGLGLFAGYESVEDLVLFTGPSLGDGTVPAPEALAFAGTALAGLFVLAWAGHRLARGPRRLAGARRRLAFSALGAPAVFGLVSGGSFAWGSVPPLPADGVWRLGAALLLVHAVVRFEHPIQRRSLPAWAAWLGTVAAAVGALLTLELGLAAVVGSNALALVILQGLLLGAAGTLAWRRPEAIQALVGRVRGGRSATGRARRKLEIYEAALLADRDPDELADLRDRFSISGPEHRLLERLTRRRQRPPEVPDIGPGDVLEDRYRLGEPLGGGAHTRVHEARDLALDRSVAVKVLDGSSGDHRAASRRFLHEARVGLRLRHPNVVEVDDIGDVEAHPYLVFELVEGGSLDERIPAGGLPVQAAGRLVEGVLSGLHHLHEQGLLHRDLKPANVLTTPEGDAKLADLGLASPWDPGRTQELGPEHGPRQGTPAYMSPEALLGNPLSPRSDVYGAGAILVEALTGRHYLELEDAPYDTVKRAVIEARPPLAGRVDDELAEVCRKALAKDPGDRFASAASMRRALLEALPSASSAGEADERASSEARARPDALGDGA